MRDGGILAWDCEAKGNTKKQRETEKQKGREVERGRERETHTHTHMESHKPTNLEFGKCECEHGV